MINHVSGSGIHPPCVSHDGDSPWKPAQPPSAARTLPSCWGPAVWKKGGWEEAAPQSLPGPGFPRLYAKLRLRAGLARASNEGTLDEEPRTRAQGMLFPGHSLPKPLSPTADGSLEPLSREVAAWSRPGEMGMGVGQASSPLTSCSPSSVLGLGPAWVSAGPCKRQLCTVPHGIISGARGPF